MLSLDPLRKSRKIKKERQELQRAPRQPSVHNYGVGQDIALEARRVGRALLLSSEMVVP